MSYQQGASQQKVIVSTKAPPAPSKIPQPSSSASKGASAYSQGQFPPHLSEREIAELKKRFPNGPPPFIPLTEKEIEDLKRIFPNGPPFPLGPNPPPNEKQIEQMKKLFPLGPPFPIFTPKEAEELMKKFPNGPPLGPQLSPKEIEELKRRFPNGPPMPPFSQRDLEELKKIFPNGPPPGLFPPPISEKELAELKKRFPNGPPQQFGQPFPPLTPKELEELKKRVAAPASSYGPQPPRPQEKKVPTFAEAQEKAIRESQIIQRSQLGSSVLHNSRNS